MTTVRYTANFAANLADIETFWGSGDFPAGFDRLLDELSDTVLPNLERHPRLGRDFLARAALSTEALARAEQLRARMARIDAQAELREYVMQDYLLLYLLHGRTIDLLAIRHYRQLSFDVDGFLAPARDDA